MWLHPALGLRGCQQGLSAPWPAVPTSELHATALLPVLPGTVQRSGASLSCLAAWLLLGLRFSTASFGRRSLAFN